VDFVADRRQVKSEIGEDLAGGGVIGEEISVDKNNTIGALGRWIGRLVGLRIPSAAQITNPYSLPRFASVESRCKTATANEMAK
jgi:hypothetical protein